MQGGIAQGVGQALWEQVAYDADSGQLLTGSLMDYCVPRADQLPPMANDFDESVPCKTNLLGVKGVRRARHHRRDARGRARGARRARRARRAAHRNADDTGEGLASAWQRGA